MLNRIVGSLAGMTSYGILGAGMTAGCVAAGAAVLNSKEHEGYPRNTGAAAGAVGGAVLDGGLGLVLGLAAPQVLFKARAEDTLTYVSGHAVGRVLSVLTGVAILHRAGHAEDLSLGHAAAAAATGAAIVYGGLALLFGCHRVASSN